MTAVAAVVAEQSNGHASSLASSSSTIAGSSLVKIGVGLATGAPTVIGCRSHAGVPE